MRTGTSSLVVAASVGPGTVLTCASAGGDFGYSLGWVLVFAAVTAFVLQSFTVGTGILARRGLGEAIRAELDGRRVRAGATTLVVLGLWVGCASFELGSLIGAASGMTALLDPSVDDRWLVALLTGAATVILLLDLRVLVMIFAVLVVGMSILFVVGLLLTPVDWADAPDRASAWRDELRGMSLFPPVGGLVTLICAGLGLRILWWVGQQI